jgi:hypothetical protein
VEDASLLGHAEAAPDGRDGRFPDLVNRNIPPRMKSKVLPIRMDVSDLESMRAQVRPGNDRPTPIRVAHDRGAASFRRGDGNPVPNEMPTKHILGGFPQ